MFGHVQGELAFLLPSPSLRRGWPLAMGLEVLSQSPHRVWAGGRGAVGSGWHSAWLPGGWWVGGQQPWVSRSVPVPCCSPLLTDFVVKAGLAAQSAVLEPASGCLEAAPGVQECGELGGSTPWVTPVGVGPATAEATPAEPRCSLCLGTFGSSPQLLPAWFFCFCGCLLRGWKLTDLSGPG